MTHQSLLRITLEGQIQGKTEEGSRETKNNAFGLATEDRGIKAYQLRRTKDVRSGQV